MKNLSGTDRAELCDEISSAGEALNSGAFTATPWGALALARVYCPTKKRASVGGDHDKAHIIK